MANSNDLKERLIIRLLRYTGMSPKELIDLNAEDVDYRYSVLYVWRNKIRRDHLAIVDPVTMAMLYEYLDKRKAGPFLHDENGERLKPREGVQWIRRLVKRFAREAGITRHYRITPYTLRHTFCVQWVFHRGDLESLRRQTGHKTLQKLQHYLDFEYDRVRAEYNRVFLQTQADFGERAHTITAEDR